MVTNKQTQKILIASILVGTLQFIYNLFVLKTENILIKALPTLFEGTFMFILIGFVFVLLFKKDIFKNWILFSIILSLTHALFMLSPLGFNWAYLLILFIGKFLMVIASIKFVDYILKG